MIAKQVLRSFSSQSIARSLMCAVLFAFFSSCAASAYAAGKDTPAYGRLEISTKPAGYPIVIDGKPAGETTTTVRLIELPPGRHTVEILFPSKTRWVRPFNVIAGRKECITLNYRPRMVAVTRPSVKSPCPPYVINVSAPANVSDGDLITFSADASNYTGSSPLTYKWIVSPASARIVGGAGTSAITVDSTGLSKQRITAILTTSDNQEDPRCRQSAQGSTNVSASAPPPVQAKKFDEFPSVAFDDDKARLDNLAIELQTNPGASGYIIVYSGRTSRPGTASRLGARAQSYLVTVRGIDMNHLVIIDGGYRERDYFELYFVPQGAAPPQPTPTVRPNDARPTKSTQPRRSRQR